VHDVWREELALIVFGFLGRKIPMKDDLRAKIL
jgi:hypothetical protein